MTLEQTISAIRPLDEKSMTAARNRFANIAMPLGGLGLLQDAIVQLAGILGQPVPDISRRAAAGVALLDLALAPYREMVSFADIGMEAYQPQK